MRDDAELPKKSDGSGNAIEPMVIGVSTTSKNSRQQETHHKMIEHVKEYHSKLDLSQHKGKGKVDLFVCCFCFKIFSEQDLLRTHFMKVSIIFRIDCVLLTLDSLSFMNMKSGP